METLNSLFETCSPVKPKKAIMDFTIGADPEFCIVDVKTVITGKILKDGDDFGVDGNGVSFEARPEPSTSPFDITNNIRAIMVRQCLKNPNFLNYDWFAGSYQKEYPLGGHIHFGIKEEVIGHKKAANILSQYVGAVSILIEDCEQGKRRRARYGLMDADEFRVQPYGFEYRCPSSWLTSPHVAAAILCLAKTVMFEVLNNDKFKAPNRIKPIHFKNMETESIRELWPDIWSEIRNMTLYSQYKSYLDMLYYMINKRQTWFPKVSMKEAWGIVDMSAALESRIQLKNIWAKFMQKDSGKSSGFIRRMA